MNINQNNIQRQQQQTLNKRQPLSFQSVEAKTSNPYLKINKSYLFFGYLKGALLDVFQSTFEFKSTQKDEHGKAFVDYTYPQLSKKLDNLWTPEQVKGAVLQLHKEGLILNCGQGTGKSRRRGNRIKLLGLLKVKKSNENVWLKKEIIKKCGAQSAHIDYFVKSHSKSYNTKKKKNINAKPDYHIVLSEKINNEMLLFMTESQLKSARTKLIKQEFLFKIRCQNTKQGKRTSKSWVYTTDKKWIKCLKESKHKNYLYTDKQLNSVNVLGLNGSQAYNLNRKVSLHKTQSCENRYPSSSSFKDLSYIDLNHYEKKKNGYFSFKKNSYKNCKQNIEVEDLTKPPSMKEFYTVCDALWATRAQADEYWHRYYYRWRNIGMPDNWVAVLISSIRRANKLNIKPKPIAGLEHCGLPQYLRAG